MFWLSEKIAEVFNFFFSNSSKQKSSADFTASLESFDFAREVSKLGKSYSILTNQVSKNGNQIYLYLSDDCKTLHDGGQVLANTSEFVMDTQVALKLPPNVKLIDGYLVNESLTGLPASDSAEIARLLNFIKGH